MAGDIELIVSELVTNSVVHAGMGPDDSIGVDVRLVEDRLRIAVVDGGGEGVPHVVAPDPERPGGMGLWLVARLAADWGVVRDRSGLTEVWCELALAGGRP